MNATVLAQIRPVFLKAIRERREADRFPLVNVRLGEYVRARYGFPPPRDMFAKRPAKWHEGMESHEFASLAIREDWSYEAWHPQSDTHVVATSDGHVWLFTDHGLEQWCNGEWDGP